MVAKDCHILIIGAGMGGLTAALALQHFGFRVTIFEQAPELGEVGAGLTITPNATHVLDHLGLKDKLAETADIPTAGAVVHYQTGEILLRTYRGNTPYEKYGAHYYQIHRADLHDLLSSAVLANDPDCLRLGHMFTSLEQDTSGVTAFFSNGASARGDVLVGCDGGSSAVRSTVFGPEPVVFTGHVALRALIPADQLTEEELDIPSKAFRGPDRSFTRYLIRKKTLVNVVGLCRQPGWEEEGWTIHTPISDMLELYKEFHPIVTNIIKKLPPELLFKWALRDRDPLPTWTDRRVTMLGDAAHPMTPFLGQGAVMAIEDAMLIGRAFDAASTPEEALVVYEGARKERANGVQLQTREQQHRYNGRLLEHYDPKKNAEGRGLFEYNPVTVPLEL